MFKEFFTPLGDKADKRLAVLNTKLCFGDFHDLNQVDFWVVEDYGVEHWTRLYTINKTVARWNFNFCTLMASSRTGDRSLSLAILYVIWAVVSFFGMILLQKQLRGTVQTI